MPWPERISVDPEILAGKPAIRGTRLGVDFILDLLVGGQRESDILANYPGLTKEDILACVLFVHDAGQQHETKSLPAS
jgi:uncharacterized protein (DUF433 family)